MERNAIPPILEVGGVLISSEILTEQFCCDYEKCHGICCVEGDAGAPVTLDEIACIEESLDRVWPLLSASAQSVIDRQGVAYSDRDGDLVTSIVGGRDCVFTCYDGDNCLCALERVLNEELRIKNEEFAAAIPSTEGSSKANSSSSSTVTANSSPAGMAAADSSLFTLHSSLFTKPISCALYPIREKDLGQGLIGLNYHQWSVCADGRAKGRELGMPVYRFLRGPLIRRFGEEWYEELCEVADQLLATAE